MRKKLATALVLGGLVSQMVSTAGYAENRNDAKPIADASGSLEGSASDKGTVATAEAPLAVDSPLPSETKVAAPNPATASTPAAAAALGGMLGPTTIADVAQAVAPAVVLIEVEKTVPAQKIIAGPNAQMFNMWFNQPFGITRPNKEMGSGFIIRPEGYILTNAHVVKGQQKILVTLNDGRKFPGSVLGSDSASDIAVVKIEATNLPIARLGTSKTLRPGDFAIAIGSPLGFDHTVTFGIISAIERRVHPINDRVNFIQTDAAINPGNSGGPLLNLAGDVVGINTAIVARGQNIGFSIPVDLVKDVADALINHRKIERPYLGIGMQPVDPTVLKSIGMPETTRGVFVNRVYPDSPAIAAGMEAGDVIQKIEGKDVDSAEQVQKIVFAHKVNDVLHLLVLRKNVAKAFACTVGQYPGAENLNANEPEDQ